MKILSAIKKVVPALLTMVTMAMPTACHAADTNEVVWTDVNTELNDVDPRLRLGRYVQNVSSNYVAESVVPIVEEYIAPVVETASNNTESIVSEFARTNTVLSSGPYVQSDELGPGIENWLDDGGIDYFNDWFPDKLVDELDYMDEENPRYYRVNQPFYFDGYSFQVSSDDSVGSHITFTADGNVLSLSNGWINVCGSVNIVKTNIVDSIWDISRLSGLYLPHSVNVGWNDRKIDLMEVATYDDVNEATKDKRDYGDISYTNDVWFFTYPNNHGDHAGQTVKFVKTGENIWSHNFPDGGSQTIKYEYAFGQWLWNWQGVYSEAASNATEVVFDDDGTKYVAFRGKRFALDTEIPNPDYTTNNTQLVATIESVVPDYASVSNAAMNAMPRAEARFTPWKPYEEPGSPAGYQLVSAVYSGNRWHLKIMIDGETTPTTYTTDDSMDAVMITFDGELNSLVRSRLASVDEMDGATNAVYSSLAGKLNAEVSPGYRLYYDPNGFEVVVDYGYDSAKYYEFTRDGMGGPYSNTVARFSDIYAATNNVVQKGEDIDMGGVIDETTYPPTYQSSAFIKFIDMWLGYGVEGSGFGIYKSIGVFDGLSAAYLFNDDDDSEAPLDVMRRKDLTSVLATYETVSNAAMSAATKTEPIIVDDGNWYFEGVADYANKAQQAMQLSDESNLHVLEFNEESSRWLSNEYYGLHINYFAYLSDLSAAATDSTNYTDSAVAFAPVSPSEQTGSYQLADRSVNSVDITDNQVLIMPASISGKLRDLYVRAQFNGVASQANLSTNDIDGTSVSFEYEDGIIPTFDRPGTYLLHIMETAAGTFSVNCDGPMVEAQYDKRLEYVSSTGTQYVDTGIIGSSNTVIEIDMAGLSAVANVAMFGAINSENRHFMAMRYNNALRFIYGTSGSSGDISVPVSFGEHTRHQFRFSVSYGGNVKIDVDGVNKVDLDTGISSTTGLPMFLFGCNRDSSLTYPATMSIYGCRIWKDGNIVRNYIPCMKDNRAALFDTITHTLSYSNSGTDLEPAASTAEEASLFAGFSLPEYVSTLSKYKYDPNTRTCYREFMENDTLILRAVTNIDLTAAGNIDALRAMEDSIEIRKPPVAQVCYSVGYESLDNVLVATNSNFKIDGNYLSEAEITMSYDVSGTTTAEIISPTAITATSESITIAESALETVRSVVGRSVTFAIQTAYGHTSITAVVAAPPTP